MANGQASIQIERPPLDVFTYATDLANMPRWQSEGSEVEARRPYGGGRT